MKIQVFTTEAVSDALRDRLSTFALGLLNLNKAHRTGPWMHVASYKATHYDGKTATVLSTPENPIYAAKCYRGFADGSREELWVVLRPNNPKKLHRYFFAGREGGEQ